MKIDKQSNGYIVAYIIILVVVVGTALAFTSKSLHPLQQANIDADKMKQILSSLHIVASDDDVKADFDKYIIDEFVVDAKGTRAPSSDAFGIDVAKEVKLPESERLLPVYEARLDDGSLKYVFPVYGAGLWGPIWGYVAVDNDGTTIYGSFFSHQGETPGLGAEIAKPAFSQQFVGKEIFKDGRFLPVEVIKKGLKPHGNADYVDGVSGATITSKGVGEMIDNSLRPYAAFLNEIRNQK